jgi:organic radical activating enzyme
MSEEKKYPISEIFTSWQGEGLFSGVRMCFVRFAGCNVGKPIDKVKDSFISESTGKDTEEYGNIPIWQEECTSWDGRKFLCDTDFRVKERLTAEEIIKRIPVGVEHICITGGEPLIHDLEEFFDLLYKSKIIAKIHIETSGTKIPRFTHGHYNLWFTVSPKFNCKMKMAMLANEIKLLVDDKFDEQKAEALVSFAKDDCIIWLSSINGIDFLDKSNMDKCKEIAERHPTWRITQQSQKIWGVR